MYLLSIHNSEVDFDTILNVKIDGPIGCVCDFILSLVFAGNANNCLCLFFCCSVLLIKSQTQSNVKNVEPNDQNQCEWQSNEPKSQSNWVTVIEFLIVV